MAKVLPSEIWQFKLIQASDLESYLFSLKE